jgi:hypothetical protein
MHRNSLDAQTNGLKLRCGHWPRFSLCSHNLLGDGGGTALAKALDALEHVSELRKLRIGFVSETSWKCIEWDRGKTSGFRERCIVAVSACPHNVVCLFGAGGLTLVEFLQ